jgi:hypothetical protein
MPSRFRRGSAFVLAGAIAVLALFAFGPLASPASGATGSCPGSRIEHVPVKVGTTVLSYLNVYYDSSTGKNCARNDKTSVMAGNPSYTYVVLQRCSQTVPGSSCTVTAEQEDPALGAWDTWYVSYAGPVTVSAAGHCIHAMAASSDSWFQGPPLYTPYFGSTSPYASHCG